jgi:pyruvate/2-oxoglutarate dehydrogenase complex dihydrolipoamide acyltransferase (E2) component
MATEVIMPALGVAQEKGTLLNWFKAEGQPVTKGEPLMEVETDKATVEIEAPASGILANVTASAGDEIPVGNKIAVILAPGEMASPATLKDPHPGSPGQGNYPLPEGDQTKLHTSTRGIPNPSPLGKGQGESLSCSGRYSHLQQPKNRQGERHRSRILKGSGPDGAVLAEDVRSTASQAAARRTAKSRNSPAHSMRRIVGERMTRANKPRRISI